MNAPGILRRRRPFLAPFWVAGLVALVGLLSVYGLLRATIAFSAETTTLILLRHAEKSAEPADDPALSAAGAARAQRLALLLGPADIAAIYASDTRRTQDTARPLASAIGLPVTVHAARDVDGLIEEVGRRHVGRTVVVVGHSNTVPAMVGRLTRGRHQVVWQEDEFDRLFVVTVTRFGPPSVVELRY